MHISVLSTTHWPYLAKFFVQVARRLLLHPGVSGPQMAGEGSRDPNQMRCVMAALAVILFVWTFLDGGKAGW